MDDMKKKILILEDEKPLARALELKLTHEGFDVTNKPNGENLLSVLNEKKYSLIICDLIMPLVDGFHVLKILKENNIKIPVVILTNLNQQEDEKRVRDLGAVDFLIKSDTPIADVIEKIKQIAETL